VILYSVMFYSQLVHVAGFTDGCKDSLYDRKALTWIKKFQSGLVGCFGNSSGALRDVPIALRETEAITEMYH